MQVRNAILRRCFGLDALRRGWGKIRVSALALALAIGIAPSLAYADGEIEAGENLSAPTTLNSEKPQKESIEGSDAEDNAFDENVEQVVDSDADAAGNDVSDDPQVDSGPAAPPDEEANEEAPSQPSVPAHWFTQNGQTYYVLPDGSYARYRQTIDGEDYLFWSNGTLARNTLWNGYYYGSDGVMYKDRWFDLNGARYYANPDGRLARYCVTIDGKDYLFWSNYTLARNCVWNGRYYGPDGALYKDRWFDFNGRRYYAHENGQLAQYATVIGGNTYLFWSDHSLARNQIYNHVHYDQNGVMSKAKWIDFNGRRYYAHENGRLAQYATDIDGKSYLFWSDHSLARNQIWNHMHFDQNGVMSKSKWIDFNGRRYYAHENGQLAQYATVIGGNTYLFWSDHSLVRNTIWNGSFYGQNGLIRNDGWIDFNGNRYYAKSDGKLVRYQNRIDGKDYLFWSNYSLVRNCIWQGNFYDDSGQIFKNGWIDFSGKRYYAWSDGRLARYHVTIAGESYLFWSDYSMAHDCWWDDRYYQSDGTIARFRWVDDDHWVGADGVWVPNMPAKVGWQNPAGYYQVSSKGPYLGIPSGYYVTSTRINPYSTRAECVETFIQRAWEYVGTPYVWNYSNAPGVGVDCIGLVYQCAYACGMNLGEFNPYDHWITGPYGWHSHDANNMWNYGAIQRLSLGSRNRGDLIFWRGHVAIYLGNDRILEAYPGVVRETSLWAHGTPIGVGRLFL